MEAKLKEKSPVVSVVAVTGTTEESAVDPLADIFSLRETLRKKVGETLLTIFQVNVRNGFVHYLQVQR